MNRVFLTCNLLRDHEAAETGSGVGRPYSYIAAGDIEFLFPKGEAKDACSGPAPIFWSLTTAKTKCRFKEAKE